MAPAALPGRLGGPGTPGGALVTAPGRGGHDTPTPVWHPGARLRARPADARILAHPLLRSIVDLAHTSPPEAPLVRHDGRAGPGTRGEFIAAHGAVEGPVRWELAGPLPPEAKARVEAALRTVGVSPAGEPPLQEADPSGAGTYAVE